MASEVVEQIESSGQFAEAIRLIEAQESAYLRSRTLTDGPEENFIEFVSNATDSLASQIDPGDSKALLASVIKDKKTLKRITLNAVALWALRQGLWDDARHLASEVVARDHHDLMSQRIIDAADAKSTDLETDVDRWLKTRTCHAPFRQIETRADRSIHFCCSAWQPVPIGRIDESGEQSFWNSDVAKEIRRSVSEGDFTHCSRWHCPAIAMRRLPISEATTSRADLHAEKGPKRVILSHDRSCNISCPSCRTKLILMDHKATARLNDMFEDNLRPFLDNADEIKVTGSGDPFGSRHFRSVLKSLCAEKQPIRRIQLHTNGLLANERAWNELGLWDHVKSIWVSIDAAEPETYSVLRRGGDFNQLVANLHFLGCLRRAGEIESLRLDFVVQAMNFDQMGDFVDLAKRVGADGVYFLRLRNWGHFSADEFRKMDVCDVDHPQHEQLLNRLGDPRLQPENVDLGSVASLKRFAEAIA